MYRGLSSAVDVMPTVLDLLQMEIPDFVQGRSLAPGIRDNSAPGREYVVSSIPFANPGDPIHSVDNLLRPLVDHPVTTDHLSGACSATSELYNLTSDPSQFQNVIGTHKDVAGEIHQLLVKFMRETCAGASDGTSIGAANLGALLRRYIFRDLLSQDGWIIKHEDFENTSRISVHCGISNCNQMTVNLLGENNAGKSALLVALARALGRAA